MDGHQDCGPLGGCMGFVNPRKIWEYVTFGSTLEYTYQVSEDERNGKAAGVGGLA